MKISLAQARPVPGNIQANIANHLKLIKLAASIDADMIIFPELSITGYEPKLASALATQLDDHRFNGFQDLSDKHAMVIGIGMPLRVSGGISIGMIIFQPDRPRSHYTKKYLHPDEEPYFVSKESAIDSISIDQKIALAICYEISVDDHAEATARRAASVYLASVDKTTRGIEQAIERLSAIAKKYSVTALVANCAGTCDGGVCGGKTSIWNRQGILIGQLDQREQGILMIDTKNDSIIKKWL
ncbi:MAG: carbon-nitrogen hydrolase family protein [Chitinophagales bacterium]